MLAVTELALLSAWEAAYGRALGDRAVILVATAAGLAIDTVADLPIGRRDQLLLDLRESCFGPRLDALASCPGCALELDVQISTDELRTAHHPDGFHDVADLDENDRTRTITVGEQTVAVRALTSRDVAVAGAQRDRLLTRCLVDPDAVVTAEILAAVEAELDDLDPGAAPSVELDCPGCGRRWTAPFELAEFVWNEVDRFARRLLADVHTLASAYGWREPDVLALSPTRRSFYLQACRS